MDQQVEDIPSEPNGPRVSKLYCLPPIGVGTPMVESLTSYTSRLAAAHSVWTGTLISKVIIPLSHKPYLDNIARYGGTRLYHGSQAINGIGEMAATWTTALTDLTGCSDLSHLSCLKWSGVIPFRDLLKPVRAWCPQCFDEWAKNQKPVYEALLWSIKPVTACTTHGVMLSDACPSCGRQMSPLEHRTLPGRCSKCGAWLGTSSIGEVSHAVMYDISSKVGLLLTEAERANYKGTALTLSRYIEFAHSGNLSGAARSLGLPKSTLWGWVRGTNLPTLYEAICVAERIQVSLVDFYIGTYPVVSKRCTSDGVLPIIHQRTSIPRQHRVLDWETIRCELERAVLPQSSPVSLMEIARNLAVDKRLLRIHFSDLCKRVTAKSRASMYESSIVRRQRLEDTIVRTMYQLHERGVYPSRRRVEASLEMPGVLRHDFIKNIWHDTLLALGYEFDTTPCLIDKCCTEST